MDAAPLTAATATEHDDPLRCDDDDDDEDEDEDDEEEDDDEMAASLSGDEC